MDGNLTSLAYLACGTLILVYAWDRFNTPASNRSSTRQALYWWSCIGYMASALALFLALCLLLRIGPMRSMLLGSADNAALPAPLIATLVMTTMLSSVPPLKQLDGWILSTFLGWGAIPAEVKRRAATLTPQSFRLTEEDVSALREVYGDGSYGDTLAGHLRGRAGEGLELSQFRFTRVLKLYDQIKKLAGEPRYARIFVEAADEFAALEDQVARFLRRSDASLTLAARLRGVGPTTAAYEDLVQERREAFAEDCRDLFRDLALFLARAVLRSEASEKDIVERLRAIGFAATEPMNTPDFPIDSLTVLALGIFVCMAAISVWFTHLPGVPEQPGGGLVTPCKIALARLVAIGVTVWLVQNYSFFRRAPGERPRYFSYVVCGAIAAAVAAAICLGFHLGEPDPIGAVRKIDLALILLTGVMCAAVALCCDDWPDNTVPPAWLRVAEAAGCAVVMAVGALLIYFGDLLPFPADQMPAWMLAMWFVLPSFMALVIGGCVPHIYRSARRHALAQRGEALPAPAPAALIPRTAPAAS